MASATEACSRASQKGANPGLFSLSIIGAPALPLASTNTLSLGLWSPSTLIMLNERPVARLRATASASGLIAASVVKNPSMVAMLGWIIPEPLAAAPIVTVTPSSSNVSESFFSTVSVVIIARANIFPLPSVSVLSARPPRALMPLSSLSIGNCSPIIPVDITSAFDWPRPNAACASSAVWRTLSLPWAPVQALAFPLLTTTARTLSAAAASTCLQNSTGAA